MTDFTLCYAPTTTFSLAGRGCAITCEIIPNEMHEKVFILGENERDEFGDEWINLIARVREKEMGRAYRICLKHPNEGVGFDSIGAPEACAALLFSKTHFLESCGTLRLFDTAFSNHDFAMKFVRRNHPYLLPIGLFHPTNDVTMSLEALKTKTDLDAEIVFCALLNKCSALLIWGFGEGGFVTLIGQNSQLVLKHIEDMFVRSGVKVRAFESIDSLPSW